MQRTDASSLAWLRRIRWRAGDSALGSSPWLTPAFRPPLTTRTLKRCCSGMQVACAAAIKSHVSARAFSRLGRLRWLGWCWRLGRLGWFRGWWRCRRLDRSCLCELRRCGQCQDRGSDIDAALHEAASRLVWHCHFSPPPRCCWWDWKSITFRTASTTGAFAHTGGIPCLERVGFAREGRVFKSLGMVCAFTVRSTPGSKAILARQWNGLERGRGEPLPAAPSQHQIVAGQPGAQKQNRDSEVTLSWSACPVGGLDVMGLANPIATAARWQQMGRSRESGAERRLRKLV